MTYITKAQFFQPPLASHSPNAKVNGRLLDSNKKFRGWLVVTTQQFAVFWPGMPFHK